MKAIYAGVVGAALLVGASVGFVAGQYATASSPEKVTGIGGIFFKASDPKATAEWYRTHLGVVIEADMPQSFFMWKEVDRPEHTARTVWAPFDQSTDYFAPGSSEFMVNYRVRDLDALLKQLSAAGIQTVGDTQDYDYGRFAWIVDIDGRKVELWQPMSE